jgi:hypothetical protein
MWPAKLAERLVLSMCPAEVCNVCGEPRRRVEGKAEYVPSPTNRGGSMLADAERVADGVNQWNGEAGGKASVIRCAPTLGFTDCGHDNYRPGVVLDPFAGTGTTLAVADCHGRDAIGIDIDARNADLAVERVGMFLDVEGDTDSAATTPHNTTGNPRFREGYQRRNADGTPQGKPDPKAYGER